MVIGIDNSRKEVVVDRRQKKNSLVERRPP